MTAGDWATTIVGILGALVAIGIAVGSALRDNRLRHRDAQALSDRDQRAEDARARQEAEKVVFVYEASFPIAHWRVTNAGDGPILDLEFHGGRDASNNQPGLALLSDDRVPLILSGRQASIAVAWSDESSRPVREADTPEDAIPVALWRDGAGRVWVRDENGVHQMPPGKN